MRMGFGFGLNKCRDNLPGVEALQAALFSNGEQGALYDLYDRSTLFQDAAGTTPWTTLGQPLGLQLDKSKGLVRGNRVNTITSVTGNAIGGPSIITYPLGGVITAGLFYEVSFTVAGYSGTGTLGFGSSSFSANTQSIVSADGDYRFLTFANATQAPSVFTRSTNTATFTNIEIKQVFGNHRYQTTPASRPTIEARVNRFVGTETLATQNVTTVAGSYILRFTGAGTVTLSGTATGAYSAGTHSITCTAGTLTATVAGTVTQADLRLSLDSAYPYQRVTTATDYADIGAPRRIKYDGIDDFLQTASVDFSATDKMTVWAGVRKLSDAAAACCMELSANVGSNNGGFSLFAPASAASNIQFISKGTAGATSTILTSAAPVSLVVTGTGDISADISKMRINGAEQTPSASDQGTGNYGTYPLYFGARAGTSLRFPGEVFSPEVIRGAASTSAQIDMVERIINRNIGGVY